MKNILTIDLEDWFMDSDIRFWYKFEDRIHHSMGKILDLLKKSDARATFFVVGYIAERNPDLIGKIIENGHEIAIHGYSHTPLWKQSADQFDKDIKKCLTVFQNISDQEIIGHRACQFSLNQGTLWAVDILKKNKIRYDSSVFPVNTPLYGVSDAPTHWYPLSDDNIFGSSYWQNNVIEIPPSVYRLPVLRKKIPVAGGFYFRLYPYLLTKHMFNKLNSEQIPVVFYIHPWELDSNQPKISGLHWSHYFNLSSTEGKFSQLLRDFQFTSVKDYFRL